MKSLATAERHGWPRHVAHQVYYSLVGRDYESELMPLALDQGVGALVWSPLGWGRLTGKVRRGQPLPKILSSAAALSSIAAMSSSRSATVSIVSRKSPNATS